MRIPRKEARSFYEIEAIKNKWSSRQLERQINSLLFDRLSKSKDKNCKRNIRGCEIIKKSECVATIAAVISAIGAIISTFYHR